MTILIIQTAFIGDVILATPVIEKLHEQYPEARIDFLLRKGNESLFTGHPQLNKVIVWDKKTSKLKNLFRIIKEVRNTKYDLLVNIHRFASSGLITFLSGAKVKTGFDKNPFSFCYTRKIRHVIGDGRHEVERNLELVAAGLRSVVSSQLSPATENSQPTTIRPKLYPRPDDVAYVKAYKELPYICIAPASVWFTKQFPAHKWVEFIGLLGKNEKPGNAGAINVYLLGSISDTELCNQIIEEYSTKSKGSGELNAPISKRLTLNSLAGNLTFLQSAALMKDGIMNYCNDSAPLHIASSVNAPATAIFCSTIPAFGFGPLSDTSFIVETKEKLTCKPCGLHGFKQCPQKHFKCAETITPEQLMAILPNQ